ncbi:MAG: phosphoribosylformylglycinamidine synthase [Oscillospiraceae bacterium]|nr:phosphoribosylformylglycinamidine synthase [Oscillospiraceae bacterium]
MVYRIFVEKKPGLQNEAAALKSDINDFLGITSLSGLRLYNRYDAENISEELFESAVNTVFSEPQTDIAAKEIPSDGAFIFAVEYLPGQFDQRADSASQCIQIISQGERPLIRSAKVYALYGELTEAEIDTIKKYVINPVEAREAALDKPETLAVNYAVPESVKTLEGFNSLSEKELSDFVSEYGLAMDLDDIKFCQNYFISEKRDPTVTEIRMIDTYWSDHCRHTTFLTEIDSVKFDSPLLQKAYDNYIATREQLNRKAPVCLMDIATLAAKYLKKQGYLDKLDESEEINACTVKIEIEADGKKEPWLLLFKNETHNHPTEIEPFGGAATCIGGAIRDPLSGRAYVYGAMRVTGAADPTVSSSETIPGKLPQRKIVSTATAGYSSYGNQIGLATGIVDEVYHPGYAAKRLEIGAVIAAAPEENVRRETPLPGDRVILLGGATGRDGIGGATGSSKAHNAHSVETCGAEVQKGNAPIERKLQRLFRKKTVCRMIKRCNDFGAGGVSVAIGELADGLLIDLNAVPKKYEGLDGTELAISESQERMAVVVEEKDVPAFIAEAEKENLAATVVAEVQEEKRLVMNWNGKNIVDISREFLNSNGAPKHIDIAPENPESYDKNISGGFAENIKALAGSLNVCSKRGLSECFDSTIGAGTVLMPFGGKNQLTPIQAMAQKISVQKKHTDDVSLMSWGYNPEIAAKSPYHGAYLAVIESVSKLIASGAEFSDVYLTLQEYFPKPLKDPKRWGQPLAALLGAFEAQKNLKIGAIGGKDSMSGSFEDLDVPPTLVSFAVTTDKANNIVSPEYKKAGNKIVLLSPDCDENSLPVTESLTSVFEEVTSLLRSGKAVSCYTPGFGGIAEAVMKCAFGNGFGFEFSEELTEQDIFGYKYGAFLLEVNEGENVGKYIGTVTDSGKFTFKNESVSSDELLSVYENKLESVYPCNIKCGGKTENISYTASSYPAPKIKTARPKVLIPAFPGTNCEYDTAKAMADAGADPEIIVIKNLSGDMIKRSAEEFASALKTAQMIFIPGGFSGSDEPDGSGKLITAFFRNALVKEETENLLNNRDGLIAGICNGFQALIKLGLVPFGKITDMDEHCPTITFNAISRHRSKIVRTRIASNKSPWLSLMNTGDIVNVPISHGEGRFICEPELFNQLAANGQIATQYVDLDGSATNDIHFNPNDSFMAVEGITSPDGRVFGKMGHSERIGSNLYKNIPGSFDIKMFEAAVKYFN